jgi:hypothetical protein
MHKVRLTVLSILLIGAMLLSACAPAVTPAQPAAEPVATEAAAPEAEAAATELLRPKPPPVKVCRWC